MHISNGSEEAALPQVALSNSQSLYLTLSLLRQGILPPANYLLFKCFNLYFMNYIQDIVIATLPVLYSLLLSCILYIYLRDAHAYFS